MQVLVVDDEALIVMLVAGWLQDLGCEVETALNGTDALATLNGKPHVEMLITDVNMPGMSGHELAERAMHMRPGLKVVCYREPRRTRTACLLFGSPSFEMI
jgi:two-component system cell cycle response regulator CpdR